MLKKVIILLLLLCAMSFYLLAADLQETLESLSGDAARNYVSPMVTSFGSDMNAGWFHKAPRAEKFGWDLEFGLVSMGTMFTSKDEDFSVTGSFNFTKEQAEELASEYQDELFFDAMVQQIMSQTFDVSIAGPTITGPAYDEVTGENSILVNFPEQPITFTYENGQMTQSLPGIEIPVGVGGILHDLPFMPLAAPQLSIGTIYGTQLAFRYLPSVQITPELGKVKYFGYGIQHNPQVWLPVQLPIDVALAYFTQQLDIGSIVETTASTTGINLSKTWGMNLLSVTPYAGAALENSEMKFHYDYPVSEVQPGLMETIPIRFTEKGKNTGKITTGLSFRIGLVNINFDYNFAPYPSASAGVMFNFSW